MRNAEGGSVPSHNVQLLTDVTCGLVLNVEATTDAIDSRQLQPALEPVRKNAGKEAETDRCAMATTPITRRCKWRKLAGWTSMDRGKTAGNESNAMSEAAWPSHGRPRFRAMPSATASPVLLDRSSLTTPY